MKKAYAILIAFLLISIFVIAEFIFVVRRPILLNSYILKTAQIVSSGWRQDIAFNILTKGKLIFPDEQNFDSDFKNYLRNLPPKTDLQKAEYDIAIIASKDKFDDLAGKLLGLSVEEDPDFSFWRVELVNFYLSMGRISDAEKALGACLSRIAPHQHCLDYKNGDFAGKIIKPVGFLSSTVNTIYSSKNF